MVEFTCCECGRATTMVIEDKAPEPPLCGACLHMPSWFLHPQVSRMIDPDMPWPWPKGL